MAHADILDQRESLRGPFKGALALHVGVIGGLVVYACILRASRSVRGSQCGRRGGGD